MTLDDLKRLLTRQTLFRLDSILSPRLVPILYALGLAAILLWAINHFFFRFGTGFGNGLWGLLEIVVFGLLAFVGLRIGCEALMVWFRSHQQTGDSMARSRYSASLLDEVRDAIRDLAEEGQDSDYAEADEYDFTPATDPVPRQPTTASDLDNDLRAPATRPGETFRSRRTARRTPPRTDI
ncbi:DUF4282 domain-containing protein [Devosia chinhatensis]|uniref:DUF4282 domain-containing protein n=1 Tax=Devosia chinhatensis TaxID=429727 RepID=A0A0F5FLP1_9HYPH|nr:DUF4282 domain-containing protein [Devosia chinhatensis]KKB09723.1 hypothetical protein VE26_07645 [Devosia chinhatensis]